MVAVTMQGLPFSSRVGSLSARTDLSNVSIEDFLATVQRAGLDTGPPVDIVNSLGFARLETNTLGQGVLTRSPGGIEASSNADLADFRNPGGYFTAQDRMAIRAQSTDRGVSLAWEGYSIADWDADTKPTNKHSINGRRVDMRNYANRVIGTKPNGNVVVWKQAVNCFSVSCGTMNGVNGNSGGLLVEAYHEPEIKDVNGNIITAAGKGRLFGQQTIVRVRGGTDPGPDRINTADITADSVTADGIGFEADQPVDDYSYGYGHTINMSGKFRAWAAIYAKGRPGIADFDDEGGGYNGLVLDCVDGDGEGGVWGGRGYWHIGTAAIYGKDGAPGWHTIGHDGTTNAPLGPIDIRTDQTVGQTGMVYADGLQILGVRNTGWTVNSGAATKGGITVGSATTAQVAAVVNAIQIALTTHGILGA